MKFTGTLIEDLMAAVERAEQVRAAFRTAAVETSSGETLVRETLLVETRLGVIPFLAEASLAEPWFASVQENDSKLLGVA
jgi:hypothetical protein